MSDHDSVRQKVSAIFRELAGDHERELQIVSHRTRGIIEAALTDGLGKEKASAVALHMSDWNYDAAFVVALHLFPERFTPGEIEAGIGLFLAHAPNHIREACRLTGTYVWESFPEDSET